MGTNILYIDDEEDLLELAETFFAEEGLRIDVCSTFEAAEDLIARNHYEVIISDVKLPRGNGQEFIEALRGKELFFGKAVLVTGDIDVNIKSLEGFDFILYKPIKFQELVLKVKELLR